MCSPKLLLISGGIGFILSFLISKIAGVGTGTAFVRGICFFFGFGGAVFIGHVLVSKFIPELLDDSNDESFNNEENDGVDVTVDDNTYSSTDNETTPKNDESSLSFETNNNESSNGKDSFNSFNNDNKNDNFSDSSGSSSSLSDIITEDTNGGNLSKDFVSDDSNVFKPGISAEVVTPEVQNDSFVQNSNLEQNSRFEQNSSFVQGSSGSAGGLDSSLEELPDISNFDVGSVADVVASAENMQSISDVSAPISDVHVDDHKNDADTINMAKAFWSA